MTIRDELLDLLIEWGDPQPEVTLPRFERAIAPSRLCDFRNRRIRLEARLRWFVKHLNERDAVSKGRLRRTLIAGNVERYPAGRVTRLISAERIRTWDRTMLRKVVGHAKAWTLLVLFLADPTFREGLTEEQSGRVGSSYGAMIEKLARFLRRYGNDQDVRQAIDEAVLEAVEGKYTFEKPFYLWLLSRARTALGWRWESGELPSGEASPPVEPYGPVLDAWRSRYLLARTSFKNTALVDAIWREFVGAPHLLRPEDLASAGNVFQHRRRLRIRLDAVHNALLYSAFSEMFLMLSLVAQWGASAEDEQVWAVRLGALARIARRDEGARTLQWATFATLVVDHRRDVRSAWKSARAMGRPAVGEEGAREILQRAEDSLRGAKGRTLLDRLRRLLERREAEHVLSAVWFGTVLAGMTPCEVRTTLGIWRGRK